MCAIQDAVSLPIVQGIYNSMIFYGVNIWRSRWDFSSACSDGWSLSIFCPGQSLWRCLILPGYLSTNSSSDSLYMSCVQGGEQPRKTVFACLVSEVEQMRWSENLNDDKTSSRDFEPIPPSLKSPTNSFVPLVIFHLLATWRFFSISICFSMQGHCPCWLWGEALEFETCFCWSISGFQGFVDVSELMWTQNWDTTKLGYPQTILKTNVDRLIFAVNLAGVLTYFEKGLHMTRLLDCQSEVLLSSRGDKLDIARKNINTV